MRELARFFLIINAAVLVVIPKAMPKSVGLVEHALHDLIVGHGLVVLVPFPRAATNVDGREEEALHHFFAHVEVVRKLRALSPLWQMVQRGEDPSSVDWAKTG